MKNFILIAVALLSASQALSQPIINSFAPASGPAGGSVTITGSQFHSNPDSNTVYFGAAKAVVTAASASALTVTVPSGATYQPITVTTGRLTAYSAQPFALTFAPVLPITQFSFTHAATYPLAVPRAIVAHDWNGDGKTDLAVASNGSTVHLLRNTGTGTGFSFSISSLANAGNNIAAIATGDMDGDGRADLCVASGDSTIIVFKNTSSTAALSFVAIDTLPTVAPPTGIAIGDLDGDGRPDMAVSLTGQFYNAVSVMRNLSTPAVTAFDTTLRYTFAATSTYGMLSSAVALARLDADSKPDIVVLHSDVNNIDNNISLLRNTSTVGTVQMAAAGMVALPELAYSLRLADIDGDGKTDVAVASQQLVALLKNNSIGSTITLDTEPSIGIGSNFLGADAGHLNGDALPDLGMGNGNNNISVFENLSGSSFGFAGEQQYTCPSYVPQHTCIADLNGDGLPDLVSTNNNSQDLAIFENTINQPYLVSAAPLSAGAGRQVTLVGGNFTGATAVSFGGVPAAAFTVLSADTIVATVGAGASGNVAVTTPNGTATISGFFWIPAPVITAFSPTKATVGMEVQIQGNNLNYAIDSIRFGGVKATNIYGLWPNVAMATVGTGASGNVEIYTPGGMSSASGFRYTNGPVLLSFAPASATTGDTVTISGVNLIDATSVSLGGVAAASFTTQPTNTIKAVVGSGASGNIIVNGPLGSDTIGGFTYITLIPPVINSFAPASGSQGDTITISGQHFTGATAVQFGGTPASYFAVVSATTIKAVVGNGASGAVQVSTTGGSASSPGFTYLPPSVINSFSPATAKTGDTVTILGRYFTGVTTVRFGGVAATAFTIVNDSTIAARVGNGASGNVTVGNANNSSSLPGFTYLPPPTVISFSPNTGTTGTTVTIVGQQFTGATAVAFGGVPASSFTVVSASVITAVVGNGASGAVTVTTPNGTGGVQGFVYLPPPVINSFSPQSGTAGTVITITGSNFIGVTTVTIGGIPVAATVINTTTIQATVGVGTSGNITVTNSLGTASQGGFTYVPIFKYVTQTGAGLKDGSSWANAWSDSLFAMSLYLQPAGTEVWMAKGIYKPNRTSQGSIASPPSYTFRIPNGVKLYGGFAGNETVLADRVDSLIHSTNQTKLSGDIGTAGFQGDNVTNVLTLINGTQGEVVDGLVIADGQRTGLYMEMGNANIVTPPAVNNCVLQNNYPLGVAGGFYVLSNVANSSLSVSNSIFVGNRGSLSGGIASQQCKLQLLNCLFTNNANQSSPTGNYSNSVCLVNSGGTLTNCTFSGNTGNTNAAVVATVNATDSVRIHNSIFWKNDNFGTPIAHHFRVVQGSNRFSVKNCLLQTPTHGTTPTVQLNTLAQDPFFVNPANPAGADNAFNTADDGLRLTTCSPALNRGNNAWVSGVAKDILGNARVFGNAVDLGAYELQQAATFVITVLAQPSDVTTNTGDTTFLFASANGGFISQQWQSFTGSSWVNLVADSVYSGVNSPVLTINKAPYAFNGKRYRCLFSNQFCSGYPSNEAVLTVRQPTITTLCPGGSTTLIGITPPPGLPFPTQWQVDTSGTGQHYVYITDGPHYSGTATPNLQLINIPSAWYGYKYRHQANSSYSEVYELKFANRWTGNVNNSWEVPGNWSCGQVPDGYTDVVIGYQRTLPPPALPSNVVLGANGICRTLTLEPGGNLTVLPGFTLVLTH
jgi:hypothetical protein